MMREEDAMSGSEVDGGTELVSGGGIPGDAEPDESTAASVTESFWICNRARNSFVLITLAYQLVPSSSPSAR